VLVRCRRSAPGPLEGNYEQLHRKLTYTHCGWPAWPIQPASGVDRAAFDAEDSAYGSSTPCPPPLRSLFSADELLNAKNENRRMT
jgi:hypothetical protein